MEAELVGETRRRGLAEQLARAEREVREAQQGLDGSEAGRWRYVQAREALAGAQLRAVEALLSESCSKAPP